MKVYLATAGEYSDYRVLEVFARREDAEAYELADDVEEYELREGPIETRSWHRLTWWSGNPDGPGDTYRTSNPHEDSDAREFDGHPNRVEHKWAESSRWERSTDTVTTSKTLVVQGWDLERVRKVYSEQRAQHIARQDMGVEPGES